MYIVILSDTHIPKRAKQIPYELRKDLELADLIIHAGDWQIPEVMEELSEFAAVEGVTGNVDGEEVKKLFPMKRKLEVNGIIIGITHGDGKGKTTEKRAVDVFKDEDIDLLIFGHSHIPLLKENADMILFNPGSPTDKRRQPRYSYGVAEIDSELNVRHVFFDDKS